MNVKIVVDSSSDLLELPGVPFSSAPLKMIAGDKEFVDDAALDVAGMVGFLKRYTDRTGTACPSAGDFLEAFDEAENVFCVTITSNLSGCYNAAMVAKEEYETAHPDRKVFVLDSLSTGPQMVLAVEEFVRQMQSGADFDQACQRVREYYQNTRLLFALGSLNNLARNGRVNPAVAKVAGVLGIRVVGRASDVGTLEPLSKCRGEKRSIQEMRNLMEKLGYHGGRVRISHCQNEAGANALRDLILETWPQAEITCYMARGLVSYYAEDQGLLMGFEN